MTREDDRQMTDKVPLSADASASPCFCQPPPVSKIATILSEIFPLSHFWPFIIFSGIWERRKTASHFFTRAITNIHHALNICWTRTLNSGGMSLWKFRVVKFSTSRCFSTRLTSKLYPGLATMLLVSRQLKVSNVKG